MILGAGNKSAALLSPWDAVPDTPLPSAEREVREIESALARMGYRFAPGGQAMLGADATVDAFLRTLEASPAIVHFSGHGRVHGAGECLVLADTPPRKGPHFFERMHIQVFKRTRGTGASLLKDGTLIVLNSCLAGRTRDFGGQREDLASAFLAEGAEAVIACALPTDDASAVKLGASLYNERLLSQAGMAMTFHRARLDLASSERETVPFRPCWMLYTYHGNPYALLPHQAVSDETSQQ